MEICPNTGKYGPEVTLYLDTFHTVYTNGDMKIYQYLRLLIKKNIPKFSHYNTVYFLSYTRDISNVCLQTYRNNRIYYKVAYKIQTSKIQTSLVNNSIILRIKNAKFLGYCFM